GAAGDAAYVSMKGYQKATVIIDITNGATVTGGAVTLKQATAVAGTGEKALAFNRMLANIDVAASQAKVETAVVNNTFTSDTTNGKRLQYILEVNADTLDADGNFDCFRVDVASMANATGTVTYILWGARYSGLSPTAN
ncbi:hypothetical protein, partial [Roseateles cavernae]|uniref:hypothetical protein n=1 Tax=Roseateles cavernae TaxID=3153578 RepID=UPI0032E4F4A5